MMKASTPHASPLTGTEPLDPLVPFLTATNWIRSANQCGVPILQIFEDEGIDAVFTDFTDRVVSYLNLRSIASLGMSTD